MLLEVWRMLPVARCMFAVRCILPAACRMLSGSCLLHAACRWLHFPRRMLRVVCHIFPDAGCMLSIVCCTISGGRLRHAVRWIVSACPFFVACRTFSVACGLISVARPRVPCRMACAVRRLSHVASRHVARCMTLALCRMLSLVRCLSRLARRLLHVVCCVLQSDTACCRVTRSRRARSASQRRLQFRAQ
jgi:hypothetical protein